MPDHPLLTGIRDEYLWNWRGDATVLPPRLAYEFDYSPTVTWAGIRVKRGWRCGNRGNVASALIEKPASGDFLPILDGGYALQYTSLMEYREGRGMVLFCQTDVSGQTESDPAAETLARNILRYVSDWRPAARQSVVYAGEPAGKRYLQSTGLVAADYEAGRLSPEQVLVVGPGGASALNAEAVGDFLQAGGRLLAIGLGEKEANSFLPVKVKMKVAEHIAAHFKPQPAGSALAGVSPAEVHNRDPRRVPLVTGGAQVVGDGVLATALEGRVVFSQLVPWQFDYSGEKRNVKRTFRRVSCGTARLLGNMGVGGETPLLGRLSSPVAKGERRMAEGLLSGRAGGMGRPLPLLPVVELPMAALLEPAGPERPGRKITSRLHQKDHAEPSPALRPQRVLDPQNTIQHNRDAGFFQRLPPGRHQSTPP